MLIMMHLARRPAAIPLEIALEIDAAAHVPGAWQTEEQAAQVSPAHRLIAAVLAQALSDLSLGGTAALDALRWLHEGRPERPWSFEWCCEAVGLSPSAVRRRVRRTEGNRKGAFRRPYVSDRRAH